MSRPRVRPGAGSWTLLRVLLARSGRGDDRRARYLIRGAELVHRVVVRVRDVREPGDRVDRLRVEVEQVAVRRLRDAEDAEVADVADVHRRRRHGTRRPSLAAWRRGEIERLADVEVPAAEWRIEGGVPVRRAGTGAPARVELA